MLPSIIPVVCGKARFVPDFLVMISETSGYLSTASISVKTATAKAAYYTGATSYNLIPHFFEADICKNVSVLILDSLRIFWKDGFWQIEIWSILTAASISLRPGSVIKSAAIKILMLLPIGTLSCRHGIVLLEKLNYVKHLSIFDLR